MKNTTKKSMLIAIAAVSFSAYAQTPVDTSGVVGYVIDQRGSVAKSGTGLCWRTGYWTPALANEECDPDLVKKAPVAAAPQAEKAQPVAPAAAVKPSAEKITVSADALFDFDKAVLRDEGKAKLDDLVSKATALKVEAIIAVGHADRIGTEKYNQNLSERRAAAVKDYLAGKGIAADRVGAEGMGEAQPVTGDTCGKSVKKTKKLIDCLQPDRRVVIEVIGTK